MAKPVGHLTAEEQARFVPGSAWRSSAPGGDARLDDTLAMLRPGVDARAPPTAPSSRHCGCAGASCAHGRASNLRESREPGPPARSKRGRAKSSPTKPNGAPASLTPSGEFRFQNDRWGLFTPEKLALVDEHDDRQVAAPPVSKRPCLMGSPPATAMVTDESAPPAHLPAEGGASGFVHPSASGRPRFFCQL